jgi:hypothetical protein
VSIYIVQLVMLCCNVVESYALLHTSDETLGRGSCFMVKKEE